MAISFLKRKMDKGFSLLEMIIYVVILTFMLVLIVEVVLSVARSERMIKAMRAVENSAIVSLERVTREMRQADGVNIGLSTFGIHPGNLVLTGLDDIGNARTVEFYLSNGQLMQRENGVELGALTESSASVTDLKFYYFSATTSVGIRTEITIESGTSAHYRVEKFYSTTLTR